MPGCIDEIDLMTLPMKGNSCCPNSDATLPFLLHVVHQSVTMMHLTRSVQPSRVVKHPLSSGCLASVDVSYDTDVANQVDILLCLRHICGSLATLVLRLCLGLLEAREEPSSAAKDATPLDAGRSRSLAK